MHPFRVLFEFSEDEGLRFSPPIILRVGRKHWSYGSWRSLQDGTFSNIRKLDVPIGDGMCQNFTFDQSGFGAGFGGSPIHSMVC